MEFIEGLKTRKSIRAFLKKSVARKLVAQILSDAHAAPSSSNQQPWDFCVISGEPLDNLRSKLLDAHARSKTAYDPSRGKTIPPRYVERTKQLFKELRPFLKQLGEENRSFIETGSLSFYDAPVAVLITIHKSLPRNRFMDIGMAAENLMLAAHARGIGTCAIGFALLYDDLIKSELQISEDFDIALIIALGYPDEASPINEFRSPRDALEDVIRWIGFEEG
jgi:nitroreductase